MIKRGSAYCEQSRCQLCQSTADSDSFHSHVTKKEYKINRPSDFDSSNVVYLFVSVVCGVQYVGSTSTPSRLRFNNYKACYCRYRPESSVHRLTSSDIFLRRDIMGFWKTFVLL